MEEHVAVLNEYIEYLEDAKKNADEWFDTEKADKDIAAFKAAIDAINQLQTMKDKLNKLAGDTESKTQDLREELNKLTNV